MFKALAISAFLALAALKPVSEMNLEELQARMREIAMEIAGQGGVITEEQQAEMDAITQRIEGLLSGTLDDVDEAADAAEAEADAFNAKFQIPDTMPLDATGRAIANALPQSFRGKTCNTDVPDTYQNYDTFYAGKGIEKPPTGIYFYRACGNDDGNNYRYSVDTTSDGRTFAKNISSMSAERRREEGVESLTLCGLPAYRSRGFQQTFVMLGDKGNLNFTDWEGPGRSVAERFSVQAAMAEAVDCRALMKAIGQ
ncbi:MAG: hypothetical protein AAF830_12790 [Pseudomonadota bacterium]